MTSDHPVSQIDETVHQRYRLGIMAFLSGVERADFRTARDELGLTDGNLNRHLMLLADAGFVDVTKVAPEGKRTRTWLSLTPAGRAALHEHVRALRSIIDSVPDRT